MILFKPEFVTPIVEMRKTQTRRLWPKGPRVREKSIHQCRTELFGKPFARIVIRELRQELLRAISLDDVFAEGLPDTRTQDNPLSPVGDFIKLFLHINELPFDANPLVWVVCFELFDLPGRE